MAKKQAIPRVILIVGANRGIGYYLVKRLLELGDFVSVLDINTDNLKELREAYPDNLVTITADAAKDEDIKNGVTETIKQFGEIDIAVHNACLCTFESEPESNYELYSKVMDINFFGALRLSKAVLPEMRKQGFGRIIFTSSGVGVTGFSNISPYASSKGAIESLAKCLEIENQRYGISFHLFHPPLTNTASSSELPIPKEMMASPQKVGKGLAEHIGSPKFVICHSFSQAIQMNLCYRHPLFMGKMMWKMTTRTIPESGAGEAANETELFRCAAVFHRTDNVPDSQRCSDSG